MAKVHFYGEIDTFQSNPQSAGDEFRAISTTEFQHFNSHNFPAGSSAFSVLEGRIIAVEIPTTNLMTIILWPTEQAGEGLPKIKCILYRGIQKSSLIAANGTDIAAINTTELTELLWDEQAKKDAAETPPPATPPVTTPPATAVQVTASSDKIYQSFFETAASDEYPIVPSGTEIGKFDANFQVEIIVDAQHFKPDLNYAASKFIAGTPPSSLQYLDIPFSAPSNQEEELKNSAAYNKVFDFLDPCAFYGSLSEVIIYARNADKSTDELKTSNTIYEDLVSNFQNKNKVYLEIKENTTLWFDFFNEYATNIEAKVDTGSFAPIEITALLSGSTASGWPLASIPSSFFPSNTGNNKDYKLDLKLPVGNNYRPAVISLQGKFKTSILKKLFKGEANIEDDLEEDIAGTHFKAINLLIEKYKNGSTELPISSYIRLKYLRQPDYGCGLAYNGLSPIEENLLDNSIPLNSLVSRFGQEAGKLSIDIFDNDIFQFGLGYNNSTSLISNGVAYDANAKLTLFAVAKSKFGFNKQKKKSFTLSGLKDNDLQGFESYLDKEKLLNHDLVELSIASNNYLVSKYSDLNDGRSINNSDSKDIFTVTISQNEISNLTTAINHADFIDELPKFLGFDNPIAGLDNNCEPYVQFNLIVKGYESIGGVINKKNVSTNITHRIIGNSKLPGFNPRLSRKGYAIPENTSPSAFTELDGNAPQDKNGNPTKHYDLETTLYLVKAADISKAELCQFASDVKNNIDKVWDSSNNWGLGSKITYNSGSQSHSYQRSHIFNTQNVEVKVAEARHLRKLKNNEVLIYVARSYFAERPFIYKNRRLGVFYLDTTTNIDLKNEIAHEFGHILGLTDYYSYAAKLKQTYSSSWQGNNPAKILAPDDLDAFPLDGNNEPIIEIVDNYSGGVPVFYNDYSFGGDEQNLAGQDIDEDFGKNFNWFHNLMAVAFEVTQVPDPTVPGATLDIYRNNKTYYELYRKYWETTAASRQTTIKLTEKQLSIIVNEGEQDGGNSILHIFDEFSALPINVNNDLPIRDFDRTTTPYYLNRINFVGLLKKSPPPSSSIENNFFAVSDFGYSPSVALTSFDDDLHKMQERIFDSSPSGPVIRESIIAWFSPFHKENTAGEIIEDSNFSLDQIVDTFSINSLGLTPYERFRQVAKLQVLQTKDGSMPQYLLYDIETGGNALSNDPTLTIENNKPDENTPSKIGSLSDEFPTINENKINTFKNLANVKYLGSDRGKNLGINGLRILLSNMHEAFFNTVQVTNYIEALRELKSLSELSQNFTFTNADSDDFKDVGFFNQISINSRPKGNEIWKMNYQNNKRFDSTTTDNLIDYVEAPNISGQIIWDNIKKSDYQLFLNADDQLGGVDSRRIIFRIYKNRSWIIRLLRDSIYDTNNNNNNNNNCNP